MPFMNCLWYSVSVNFIAALYIQILFLYLLYKLHILSSSQLLIFSFFFLSVEVLSACLLNFVSGSFIIQILKLFIQ